MMSKGSWSYEGASYVFRSYDELMGSVTGRGAARGLRPSWMRLLLLGLVLICGALAGASRLLAAETAVEAADERVTIVLRDGSTLIGRVVEQDETRLRVITVGGLEVNVPRETIVSIEEVRGREVDGRFLRSDPNYSRLMFAPTGRPLRQGHGYFNDFYVLFPSVAYGVTDNVSVSAGMSFIPGIALDEQLFFVAPRVGFELSSNVAVSAGALYASAGQDFDEVAAGVAFGVATLGPPDKSLTAGLGFGYVREDADLDFDGTPIVLLGGTFRLSNSVALVSENWLVIGEDFSLGEQPLGVALRFFGERLSADVGVVLVGELLDEGLPLPWLSFSYHFGER